MNRMKKFLALYLVGMLCLLSGLTMIPDFAQAGYTEYVAYNVLDATVGFDGSTKNNFNSKIVSLNLPQGMAAVTYIKGRVYLSGTSSYVEGKVKLAYSYSDWSYESDRGNGSAPIELIYTTTKNTWIPFERYFSTNECLGNKNIYFYSRGANYYSFYTRVIIDEVRYRVYKFDTINVSLTPEKYVKIDLNRNIDLGNTWLRVVNATDNNRVVYESKGLSGSQFSITDTMVQPEKTYTYNIMATFGICDPPVTVGSISIRVPSDATLAWEAAEQAKASADLAASRVWDTAESKSVAQLAKEARDKANQALAAVNNMQTMITDIKNTVTTDNVPPSVEVRTLSGATATSGSSIRLVIAASDNKSTSLSYNVNGGAYSPLPADGKVDVPLTSPGPNTIVIGVQDEAGNVATKAITIWKL